MVELPLLPSSVFPTDKSTTMLMATMLTESFVRIPKVAISQNIVICYRQPSVNGLCGEFSGIVIFLVVDVEHVSERYLSRANYLPYMPLSVHPIAKYGQGGRNEGYAPLANLIIRIACGRERKRLKIAFLISFFNC